MKRKDELTWQDIQKIVEIADSILPINNVLKIYPTQKEYYSAVLERYENSLT